MTTESDRADAVDKPIVFVGQMGVGKSTLGRLLASALDRPFVDSDEYIRRDTGRNAREVAESMGVEDLHALELEALADALTTDGVVVAAAASVIDSERGRSLLDKSICVWVDRPGSTEGEHRREVGDSENLATRRPLFESAADLVLSGEGGPEEYLGKALAGLEDTFGIAGPG